MHVALLTDGIYPVVVGGIQKHSVMLAQYLARAGADVTVFVPETKIGENQPTKVSFNMIEPGTIRLEALPVPPEDGFPGHYLRGRRARSRAMLDRFVASGITADFIYAQGLMGTAFTDAKKQGLPLPPVGANLHGYEMFQRSADFRRYLEQRLLRPSFRRAARDADLVFSFSGKIRDIVERKIGIPGDRIVEVPNGIDASWIRDARVTPGKRRTLIFIGRWERRKGIEELTRAVAATSVLDFEMHFVGPIPQDRRLNLANVHYHDTVTDAGKMADVLDAADALICPSYAEGMPTVILEAMARGLAILATDVGANRELVDARNGKIIPHAGQAEIETAIRHFLAWSDADLAARKQISNQRIMGYTWDRVAERTIDAIRCFLDAK